MIAKNGRTVLSLLAFLGVSSIAPDVHAQGNTFNPFGNSGYADYREFGNPMYSNNPALPGQARLNSAPLVSRPRANSFQQYMNDQDGIDSDRPVGTRGASGNIPYYQAYQRLNSQYNRVYQPNNTPEDRLFHEKQKQRDEAYAKALREPDPTKRARLLRQVQQDTRAGTSRPAATKGAGAPKPAAGGPPTTARSAAPAERRLPAPPPPSTNSTRQPTSSNPAIRTPIPGRSATTPRPGASGRDVIPDPSTIAIPAPR